VSVPDDARVWEICARGSWDGQERTGPALFVEPPHVGQRIGLLNGGQPATVTEVFRGPFERDEYPPS
jgi:hypothetical protein